jgi:hypothetical protein
LTANTPTLIDEFLPAYDVAERHQVEVRVRIERVYDAVHRMGLRPSSGARPMASSTSLRPTPPPLYPSFT